MIAGGYSYYGLDDGVDIIDNPEDISKNTRTVTAYSPGKIFLKSSSLKFSQT